MFENIVKRVGLTAETAVHRITGAALVGVFLILALVFLTWAATGYATDYFGEKEGRLVIAAVFAVLAALSFIFTRMQGARDYERSQSLKQGQEGESAALLDFAPLAALSSGLMQGVRVMAPNAARAAARQIPRNAPLLIGAGMGLLVAQRLVNYFRDNGHS